MKFVSNLTVFQFAIYFDVNKTNCFLFFFNALLYLHKCFYIALLNFIPIRKAFNDTICYFSEHKLTVINMNQQSDAVDLIGGYVHDFVVDFVLNIFR